ncbi:MAG: hypothetical protein ACPG5U_12000 [Planktomarina sp.]
MKVRSTWWHDANYDGDQDLFALFNAGEGDRVGFVLPLIERVSAAVRVAEDQAVMSAPQDMIEVVVDR